MPDLVCLCCHASTPTPALTCHACGEATWTPVEAAATPAEPAPTSPQQDLINRADRRSLRRNG